ncbi:DUF2577 family protein [Clostridium butyricum]|uniref:DUF2577 family protein n=1 Tax=Clostridium butyricum TaxID=1492 RepID=UPI00071E6230|nr:DUF2577 family protein [Clostridium butyricum]
MLIEDIFMESFRNSAMESVDIKETAIGVVESVNPIQIKVDGLILYYSDLYINCDLLEHTETFKTLTGTVGDRTTTISNGSIIFNSKLSVGDKVALRETTDDRYYVSGKVKGGI